MPERDRLDDDTMRLQVETEIETGLRWGELAELRVKDIDLVTGVLTVSRVVVELNPRFHPEGRRFLVKDYPKDKEWRQLRIADHLTDKIRQLVETRSLDPMSSCSSWCRISSLVDGCPRPCQIRPRWAGPNQTRRAGSISTALRART
jgi:integrase